MKVLRIGTTLATTALLAAATQAWTQTSAAQADAATGGAARQGAAVGPAVPSLLRVPPLHLNPRALTPIPLPGSEQDEGVKAAVDGGQAVRAVVDPPIRSIVPPPAEARDPGDDGFQALADGGHAASARKNPDLGGPTVPYPPAADDGGFASGGVQGHRLNPGAKQSGAGGALVGLPLTMMPPGGRPLLANPGAGLGQPSVGPARKSSFDTSGSLVLPAPPIEPPEGSLRASTDEISASQGGLQRLFLDAGREHGDELYWVLGSATGSEPGFVIDGYRVPLVVDAYTLMTIHGPSPQLVNQVDFLDAGGAAQAGFQLNPMQTRGFVGMTLYHAFVVIDMRALAVDFASNAVALTIVP